MAKWGFLIFWNVLLFFLEFYCPGQVWTEFGTKIFSHFLGLSNPKLSKNNAGKSFFNFFIFFCYFFRNFLARVEYERNYGITFFFSFSAFLIPLWLKILPERGFLIFWILLPFFRNFFNRVEYEQNSGLKFFFLFLGQSHFFSLSWPISSRFG